MEGYYYDEPIRISEVQKKSLTPHKYRAMRTLEESFPRHHKEAQIFYLQAKFMENFEDDFPYEKEIICFYPTYRSLKTAELRGYFTWRAGWRKGDGTLPQKTYALIYLYELFHCIGFRTAKEAYAEFLRFSSQCEELLGKESASLKLWRNDFLIYYDLDPEHSGEHGARDADEWLMTLTKAHEVSDRQLFDALCLLSPHKIQKSAVYRKKPDTVMFVLCHALRSYDERYAKGHLKSFLQKLLIRKRSTLYLPFRQAVFYDHLHYQQYSYELTPLQQYHCNAGEWFMDVTLLHSKAASELKLFVRTTDRILRETFDIRPALKADTEPDLMVQCILDAIREEKQANAPKITFDLGLLGQIRKSADQTEEKLLTEEERWEMPIFDTPDSAMADEITQTAPEQNDEAKMEAASTSEEQELPLSETESDFLKLLLQEKDPSAFLREKHLMASLTADHINELLFDFFDDNILEFAGAYPSVVEDYAEELKGLLQI
ncbi:MAG: TerB N-terminal domain-containing protein [Eubacteriales bacterium]|nr:TerB N-terminal domain-containing protein [Eubacteriales bacterium]